MSARPPALRQDLVDRLRALSSGAEAARGLTSSLAGLRSRAARLAGRPLRKVVVRLVDPSLQTTLDQLRRETAAVTARGAMPVQPEIEVLRAELAATHAELSELRRRLDDMERAVSDASAAEPPPL
ncbi:MAG TPA: hypothetical protein VGV86_16625 [Acidimicrobiales bacterium]|nr:hypothetical protein [Acidimicrobiales bacterium]